MGQQTVGEYLTRATMRPKVGGIVQQVRIEGLIYSPRGPTGRRRPTLKATLPPSGPASLSLGNTKVGKSPGKYLTDKALRPGAGALSKWVCLPGNV